MKQNSVSLFLYNLRSAKQDDTQMHTQLCGDMAFVTQLLGAGPSTSSQQGCDSQLSDSELNCSDIVDASDSDDAGSRNRSFNKFQPEQPSTSVSHMLDAQTVINQQILAQLMKLVSVCSNLKKVIAKNQMI